MKRSTRALPLTITQERQLYVADPKALHHIVIKVCVGMTLAIPFGSSTYRTKTYTKSILTSSRTPLLALQGVHLICESSANSILFGKGLLTTLGALFEACISSTSTDGNVLAGDHHKKQRKLMNPVFSTAHMRNMSVSPFRLVALSLTGFTS